MRSVQDKYLPPDHDAFLAAEPPTGRVVVIAPTRAACETIELAMGLHVDTLLEREHGAEIRALAAAGKGFGIVAGTGTGKTLAVRPIAETILGTTELKVGVVNREREATPETPSWNVVIITTGIARRWFEDGDLLPRDTLVVDEIHQTSAELELCLALGKRVGCRFVWLSATVDPAFYARYLGSAAVLETTAFDPTKAAKVYVVPKEPREFLDEHFLRDVYRQRRGVGAFLPTRAGVEQVAADVRLRAPRIETAFYHGGEPIRVIRPFLEDDVKKPYLLAMTAAGQSALNVRGLDTVVIDDKRFSNIIEGGKNVLTRLHLGSNEILQMAGRVHGRVEGGRVYILSDRNIVFSSLRPTEPEFQLAGDSERVAITCAALGVRADELDLPVPLDKTAYRNAVTLLEQRGIIENGRLSSYGKAVEALPTERAWAELLVHSDDALVPFVAIMCGIESLHRMTREDRMLDGLILPGSDHLTAYNLYAEAYSRAGYIGEVYGLPRHLFDAEIMETWAEERGALIKAIEDAALGMASVYRALGLPLPAKLRLANESTLRAFAELLARFMPFELVIDEQLRDGAEARVSKTSVCGRYGAISGELRYFADRSGVPRASIEGTEIPYNVIRKYAQRGAPELTYEPERKRSPLALRRTVEFFGFELEREVEAVDEWPAELAQRARHVLAESVARWEARHHAVKRNRAPIEELREVYRRSGGLTPRLGVPELTSIYEDRLAGVQSLDDFRAADLSIDADEIVPHEVRERYLALPGSVEVRGREVEIQYDVEDNTVGVARLKLPEKLARTLSEEELPVLDRPLRFAVMRGQRGSVRARTLDELQDTLDMPWTAHELMEDGQRGSDERRPADRGQNSGRNTRRVRGSDSGERSAGEDRGSRRGNRGSVKRGGSNKPRRRR